MSIDVVVVLIPFRGASALLLFSKGRGVTITVLV
jgi:hypothetical protein